MVGTRVTSTWSPCQGACVKLSQAKLVTSNWFCTVPPGGREDGDAMVLGVNRNNLLQNSTARPVPKATTRDLSLHPLVMVSITAASGWH